MFDILSVNTIMLTISLITGFTIGGLLCVFVTVRKMRKHKSDPDAKYSRTIYIPPVITGIFLIGLIGLFAIQITGYRHGMTTNQWKSSTVKEIIESNKLSHVNQKLPDNPGGSIVIVYKYACPDCEAIYDELMTAIEENGITDIYFVASNSEDGQYLVENAYIKYVPSGVYIRNEPLSDGTYLTNYLLCDVDEDGNAFFNSLALSRLIDLQADNL